MSALLSTSQSVFDVQHVADDLQRPADVAQPGHGVEVVGHLHRFSSGKCDEPTLLSRPAGNPPAVFPIIKLLMNPLFIPLKTEFYEQFVNGTKPNMEEYRLYGPRWNEKTCPIGRPVTISKGYGIRHRRTGMVVGFEVREEPTRSKAWIECYGDAVGHKAACIRIKLDEVQP